MKEVTLDATNQSLGRLASQAAVILMGKDKANYQPHEVTGDRVKIVNIDKVKLTGKKLDQKVYHKYTGYPGNLKDIKASSLTKKQLFERAIYNMLPKNKLRKKLIHRLIIE